MFVYLIKGMMKKATLFISPHTFSYSCLHFVSLPSLCSGHISFSLFPYLVLLYCSFTYYLGLIKLVWGPLLVHMGVLIYHGTAELWLGSPTLSSVCSYLLFSSTTSTPSHYSSAIVISYPLVLIYPVIFCS